MQYIGSLIKKFLSILHFVSDKYPEIARIITAENLHIDDGNPNKQPAISYFRYNFSLCFQGISNFHDMVRTFYLIFLPFFTSAYSQIHFTVLLNALKHSLHHYSELQVIIEAENGVEFFFFLSHDFKEKVIALTTKRLTQQIVIIFNPNICRLITSSFSNIQFNQKLF